MHVERIEGGRTRALVREHGGHYAYYVCDHFVNAMGPGAERFTDMLGAFNQYVANRADEVYLLVSGISIQIKGVFLEYFESLQTAMLNEEAS